MKFLRSPTSIQNRKISKPEAFAQAAKRIIDNALERVSKIIQRHAFGQKFARIQHLHVSVDIVHSLFVRDFPRLIRALEHSSRFFISDIAVIGISCPKLSQKSCYAAAFDLFNKHVEMIRHQAIRNNANDRFLSRSVRSPLQSVEV